MASLTQYSALSGSASRRETSRRFDGAPRLSAAETATGSHYQVQFAQGTPEVRLLSQYRYAYPIRAQLRGNIADSSFSNAHGSNFTEYRLRRKTPGGTLMLGYDGTLPPSDAHVSKHYLMHLGRSSSCGELSSVVNHTQYSDATYSASIFSPLQMQTSMNDGYRNATSIYRTPYMHSTQTYSGKPTPSYQTGTRPVLEESGRYPASYPGLGRYSHSLASVTPDSSRFSSVLNCQFRSAEIGSIDNTFSRPWYNHEASSAHPQDQSLYLDQHHLRIGDTIHEEVNGVDDRSASPTNLQLQAAHQSLTCSSQQRYPTNPFNTRQSGSRKSKIPISPQTDCVEDVLNFALTTYKTFASAVQKARRSQHAPSISKDVKNSNMVISPNPPQCSLTLPQRSASSNYDSPNMPCLQNLSLQRNFHRDVQRFASLTRPNLVQDRLDPVGAPFTKISEPYPAARFQDFSDLVENSLSDHGAALVCKARQALEKIDLLHQGQGPTWVGALLVGGCLAYVLGEYWKAIDWFHKILCIDSGHVEAISNLAATYLVVQRRREAEHYWRLAIRMQPDYLEATENLVGLLCSAHRQKEAVEVIDYIQTLIPGTQPKTPGLQDVASFVSHKLNHIRTGFSSSLRPPTNLALESDRGRLMFLVHAKGNMLYNMGDHTAAAKAFEEVILASIAQQESSISDLVQHIISVLHYGNRIYQKSRAAAEDPLLLSPQAALQTARLCFPPTGDLPGLRGVTNAGAKQAAVSVTSNCLLSLAKIYQDGLNPNSSSVSTSPKSSCNVRDILALYYLSLALQPSPSTANNVGILMASVQEAPPKKVTVCQSATATDLFRGIPPGSGIALALEYYRYGLGLDAKHAHLYTNLGSLLKDIGQLPQAIQMYEKAVACDPNFDIALANLANAVKDKGKTIEAINYYRRAVKVNPKFAEAVCGLANALNSICAWDGRGGIVSSHIVYDRWHVDDRLTLIDALEQGVMSSGWIANVVHITNNQLSAGNAFGSGFLSQGQAGGLMNQFIDCCGMSPKLKSEFLALANQRRNRPWEGAWLIRLLERVTRRRTRQWYIDKHVHKYERGSDSYQRPQLPTNLPAPIAPTVLPFHTFTLPMSARQIRLISQMNATRVSYTVLRAQWLPDTVFPPPSPPRPALHVGYVSSDFNNHPLAHLMQSVFGMHDAQRVKAFCYATSSSDGSIYRQKIEREAPMFRDVSSWSSEKIVKQIVDDEIHVLINLNGYTRGARNEIFAARPAPIQMAFMGFAGSLGSEWCDYLLADDMAVPHDILRPYRRNVDLLDLCKDGNHDEHTVDWVYGENIVYTRSSFFCCDHLQSGPDATEADETWNGALQRRTTMRKELFPHLSPNTVIYGNFNQLYKIDPTTFRMWLRILSRVPNSILWLLRFPDLGEAQLRRTAQAWAGAEVANRIMFTDVAPKALHIARACAADLFLDTPECNAHTTAADCLWSGTPLLTLPRYKWKMCSRMAASILGGALPMHTSGGKAAYKDLVASSDEEYEDMAVRLGRGLTYNNDSTVSGRLVELRQVLWSNRRTSRLFDTARWVKDLEDAYEEVWGRWLRDEGGDIWLQDLPTTG